MTNEEKVRMLKHLTDETDEGVLSTYLYLAEGIVRSKAFPYGDGTEEIPAKYESTLIDIAVYLLNKRGAEGEKTHSENGIQRVYEDGDIPPTLIRRITPSAGVL